MQLLMASDLCFASMQPLRVLFVWIHDGVERVTSSGVQSNSQARSVRRAMSEARPSALRRTPQLPLRREPTLCLPPDLTRCFNNQPQFGRLRFHGYIVALFGA